MKSQGYRPTNANRAEVDELRAELATLRSYDWLRARRVMKEISETLGCKSGPTGGVIAPRACKYCDFYGHTRQWCQKRIRDEQAREERETNQIIAQHMRESAKWGECKDVAWAKLCEHKMRRYEAACDAGHGCVAGADYPCDECEGCKAWDVFMEIYDSEHGTGA